MPNERYIVMTDEYGKNHIADLFKGELLSIATVRGMLNNSDGYRNTNFLDRQEFYEVMQTYRHSKDYGDGISATKAYQQVIDFIREQLKIQGGDV